MNRRLTIHLQELVECLKDLEHICPSPEDFRQLCALLTLPKLSDHEDFHNWNPSAARIECFHKIFPMVAHLLPPAGKESQETPSLHDRLVQLMAKGVFYEGCVDYCQSQAVGDTRGLEHGPHPTQLLANRPRLSSTDLSLVSWLEMVSREQFAMPFEQKELDLHMEQLKWVLLLVLSPIPVYRKPKLEAQWTETIMATPVKPGNNFPHSMVPTTKMKFAEKMSQSMAVLPMSLSMTTSQFQAVCPLTAHSRCLSSRGQGSANVPVDGPRLLSGTGRRRRGCHGSEPADRQSHGDEPVHEEQPARLPALL